MNPGGLSHRIKIEIQTGRQNEYGEPLNIGDEGNYIEVWASITPIVGKEFFAAEKENSEITHKIRIRYASGIKPSMRVNFNNRIFQIMSVINYQERNSELQLMCKELL